VPQSRRRGSDPAVPPLPRAAERALLPLPMGEGEGGGEGNAAAPRAATPPPPPAPLAWLGQGVGHTRFVVLIAVAAVLLVAISLFALGAVQAVSTVWQAWVATVQGTQAPHLSVEFLGVVSVMLEAVVFFLIGVGLYSLFIAPLNLAVALGVETIHDLEERVISVVVAVLAVTFLQHFIRWEELAQTLQFGAALALTVASLVLFQRYSHRAKEDQKAHKPEVQDRSKRKMFQEQEERHEIRPGSAALKRRDGGADSP
jgi:uncharacterized membrane protein YqhA